MISVAWISNFGNNMFQYAVLYGVSKKTGLTLTTNGWHGEATARRWKVADGKEIFNLPPEPDFSLFHHTNTFNDSNDQKFNPNIFNIPDGTLINGYFQTDKYFIEYRKDLIEFFKLKNKEPETKALDMIKSLNKKVVIVAHSRETDYGEPPFGYTIIVPQSYFKNSLDFIVKHNNISEEDIGMILVSDNKTSDKLDFLKDTKIPYIVSQENSQVDMELLKHADHCITSASTFSWWGAWLNEKNPTIVSPDRWRNFGFQEKTEYFPLDIKMSIPNQYFINEVGEVK